MHAGRRYPFARKYWTTQAWFWPGFLPWKMCLHSKASTWFPYSQLPDDLDWISDEVTYNPNATIATYKWDLATPSPMHLVMELDMLTGPLLKYARWLGVLETIGIPDRRLECLQAFPQRKVLSYAVLQMVPPSISGCPAGIIPWEFRPATYAQGGSPWPNY
jgi:hypothetical protein